VAFARPSGSGKTTLRASSADWNFDNDEASVSFYGEDVTGLPAHNAVSGSRSSTTRCSGIWTCLKTLRSACASVRSGRARRIRNPRGVEKLLKLIQLESLGKRYPSQLSGGQRQRVRCAARLPWSPKVLLLDERLARSDAKVRKELRCGCAGLHEESTSRRFLSPRPGSALEVATGWPFCGRE